MDKWQGMPELGKDACLFGSDLALEMSSNPEVQHKLRRFSAQRPYYQFTRFLAIYLMHHEHGRWR